MRAPLTVLLLAASCATTAASTGPRAEGPSPVIARYGDRQIRQAEVDARVADELEKLNQQLYELRTEAAERIALEALVQAQARKEGLSEDEWLRRHVEQALPEPGEAEMRALFEKARARLPPDVTYDDVRPQLRQAVEREVRAKKAREVFEVLKRAAGYVVVLPPPERPRKAVEAVGPSRGPAEAKVVIVVFSDFECPFCQRANETLEAVRKAYAAQVRVVFRHFPLSFHRHAARAAEAAACADEQGKFWAMHDSLFESQALEVDALKLQAQRAGADAAKFDACLDSGRMAALVQRDQAAGARAGVTGTPAFFINGVMLTGAQPLEAFEAIIDAELARLAAGR